MLREAWNNHAISDRLESVVCLGKNVWWDLGHVSCPRIIQVNQLVFRGCLWFRKFEGCFDTYFDTMNEIQIILDWFSSTQISHFCKNFRGSHTFPNTWPVQTPHVSSLCSLEFPPSQKNVRVAQHVRLTVLWRSPFGVNQKSPTKKSQVL